MLKEYQEKLYRRNARIVALWKWRYLILGVLTLFVIGSILMVIAGCVTSSDIKKSFVYGDALAPSGHAIFGDVTFFFRAEGGDWTQETPKYAGNYEAKAVSHGLAGKPRYGKTMAFEIKPAPLKIKVKDAEVDFGNLPQSVAADNLKFGDKLDFGDFDITYRDNTADVAPKKDGVRITDAQNNDVTSNYNIIVETKTIIVRPVKISVTTPSDNWVYDGTEHSVSDINIEGLLDGHTVGEVSTTTVSDVGSYDNNATFKIFDEDNNDVTIHYDIEESRGKLIIAPRPLAVTTYSASSTYDGAEHTLSNEPKGQLVDGHKFKYKSETLSLTNVGNKVNDVEFDIIDADGKSVKSNYDVSTQFGSLQVTKRPLVIKTESEEIVYDGKPHSKQELSADNLANGQAIVHSEWKFITDVGSITNDFDFEIHDDAGKDVKDNYRISVQFGSITVTARPLTVTTDSALSIYDGIEHTLSNEPKGQLADGHKFKFVPQPLSLIKVGKSANEVDFEIVDANGDNVEGNYEVDTQFGELEITKRRLTIATGSATKEYDGKMLANVNKEEIKIEGLAPGEELTYPLGMVSITDAGSIPNSFVKYLIFTADYKNSKDNYDIIEQWGTLTVTPRVIHISSESHTYDYDKTEHGRNKGSYRGELVSGHKLVLSNWACRTDAGSQPNIPETIRVEKGSEDVTKNYKFDFSECGTLTVNPRELTVTTSDAEFVYDGTPKSHGEYHINGLLSRHTVTSYEITKVTGVTDKDGKADYADNIIESLTIKDRYSGKDVSNNYTIKGTWGKIRVKAPIVVRLFNLSKIYDGKPLSYKSTDWKVESLPVDINAKWLKVELKGEFTEVGSLDIQTVRGQSVVTLVDDEGKNLLDGGLNRVDFVGAPLTVHAIPLTVGSSSVERSRDGETLHGKDIPNAAWISSGKLLNGHTAEFTVTGELEPDQLYAENTVSVRILDEKQKDVTAFYDIVYNFGRLSWL